ncbi:MAG: methyltransferase domain-containing protein [Anaerolineae bacterium]
MPSSDDEWAGQFDRGRSLSIAKEKLWLALFKQHLGLVRTSRLLDVGCGTGRFAISIARNLECTVIGIDPSLPMLTMAVRKNMLRTYWFLARAEALPCASESFDACLVSQVMHHLQDKHRALQEIYRTLQTGGRIGIRASSHAQLKRFLDYRFFPSALTIDLERMPDVPAISALLEASGFTEIQVHVVSQPFMEPGQAYLDKLRNKYSSGLRLISEQEYRRGLEQAARYLKHELTDADRNAELSFIVAIK